MKQIEDVINFIETCKLEDLIILSEVLSLRTTLERCESENAKNIWKNLVNLKIVLHHKEWTLEHNPSQGECEHIRASIKRTKKTIICLQNKLASFPKEE